MTGVDKVNSLPRADAVQALLEVCHSRGWAEMVADARPFADVASAQRIAEDTWQSLDPAEWLRALQGHPRIGEQGGTSPHFSRQEQAGMSAADADVRAAIAEGNREYEQRFSHVFLISAAGRTPQEILENLRSRLGNDAKTELRVGAEQHRLITRLRLGKLLAG